ncbi:MAG: ATP-dependent Clp protease adaptor ClpS [Bacteroidales bacterium]
MKEKNIIRTRPLVEEFTNTGTGDSRHLILHNDEVHTFDYVIDSLIEVCEMETVQAEQCTFLVHYKGKCDIKKGNFNLLRPYRLGLIERGLNATIE